MLRASVAGLTAGLALLPGTSHPAAPTGSARVVVIAVPDLRWADVEWMPRLLAWSSVAAVADLSVKTATGTPRCPDAMLTFSAGDRADAGHGLTDCVIPAAQYAQFRHSNLTSSFAAHVGALGSALAAAGLRTAAVGDAAVPLLADESGRVGETTDFATALRTADVVGAVDDQLYAVRRSARVAAAHDLDGVLAAQLAQVPAGAMTIVAGISDGALTRMHLHALLIRGPGWPHRELRSPSTRAPYVQLRDLAPTILAAVHAPVPDVMVGRPAYPTSAAVRSPASYADDDDKAVTARDVGRPLRVVFIYLGVAVLLLFLGGARWPPASRAAGLLAAFGVGAPVGSFLVMAIPWWRWPTWLYGVLVGAVAAAVGGAVLVARRQSAVLALVVGPAVTAAVLVADQLAGAPLQLSAPLGDNPVVAGRFHGMGNMDFALMCTAMVLCAAVAARTLGRRSGLVVAMVLCVIAVVVDGAPALGDDFGGLLTMVPTVAVLLVLVVGVRLTRRRVLVGVLGAAAVVVAVALADYARPAAQQTHIGTFVGQVLHGGAGRVIDRKLSASLQSFSNGTLLSLVAVLAAVLALGRRSFARLVRQLPGLREGLIALVPLAVLGTFLNDSGLVVGCAVITLGTLAVGASGVVPGAGTGDHDGVAIQESPS